MTDHWLILGAGYVGGRMARQLTQEGHAVIATLRAPEHAQALEEAGVYAVLHDFSGDDVRLPERHPRVAVLSIPPTRDGEPFAEGAALAWAAAQGAQRIIYWSSTSVYGSSDGAEVREDTNVAPDTEIGRRRLEAEVRVRNAAATLELPVAIVRMVGIYGPGRNLKQRLERGDYRLVDEGEMWSNRIHVDDIIGATRHIAEQADFEGVWLLSDGRPFQVRDFVRWNVEQLGLPMPPNVSIGELAERARAFWTGNRKVIPARLEASGWQPMWPDWREGTLACWREEGVHNP